MTMPDRKEDNSACKFELRIGSHGELTFKCGKHQDRPQFGGGGASSTTNLTSICQERLKVHLGRILDLEEAQSLRV